MSLSINLNSSINRNLTSSANSVSDSIKRISTGLKDNNSSAYQIQTGMTARMLALGQSGRNMQTGNAMLNTASGGLNSTVKALSSLQQGILQAMNGTNSSSDTNALRQQATETVKTVDQVASSTNYNGISLLDGSLQNTTFAGVDGDTQVSISDMSSQGLGLTDSEGNSTLDFSSYEGLSNALDTVNSALSTAMSQQSQVGSAQSALSTSAANYTVSNENLTGASSTMSDADIASEATKMRSNMTMEQVNISLMAHQNKNNSDVLALLQF